jgi:hypothetical protein
LGIRTIPDDYVGSVTIDDDKDDIPRLGIGIARADRPDQFKLAVRLESTEDLGSPHIARILAIAHGEVDLQVTGPISVIAPGHVVQQSRTEALRLGSTVGVKDSWGAGTAGVFVRERGSKELCLLSNNHVLANMNQARIGATIHHHNDTGPHHIGRLKAFKPVRARGVRNEVDCAIATLDPSYPVDLSTLAGGGRFNGGQSHLNHLGMPVTKVGATTGRTHGYVSAFEFDTWIGFGPVGNVYFVNQIEIRGNGNATHFSQAGDSGSLVMDGNHDAFGLLFAASTKADLTYCNAIGKVLEALNIEVINAR